MSFPSAVKNQLLVDCNHRCCKCKVSRVQLHHIEYISKGGPNTYENGIPLCSNCHNEVHRVFYQLNSLSLL
ncbi:hypothetical protein DMO16_05540 [Fictibacillus sp. S7]|nr:hypothetical protein DMO16_05540 [Fictibacillus sp. S7]